MLKQLEKLYQQPYWIVALIVGAALVAVPCVSVTKDHLWQTHPPTTLYPVVVGIGLLILSAAAFVMNMRTSAKAASGLDLSPVHESDGALWTLVGSSEIRVVSGRIEEVANRVDVSVALPCNEYFDDDCATDTRSALGAYVSAVFGKDCDRFAGLIKEEAIRKLGPGQPQQKTSEITATSFGAGKCLLLEQPLGRGGSVVLVSTTTQRAGEGLSGQIAHLFNGMRELVSTLADRRIDEVIMPVLGAGHGGIYPPLALVGLLLAVAEAARHGKGGQRLRKVTVVVFQKDAASPPQVAPAVIRRALALVGH